MSTIPARSKPNHRDTQQCVVHLIRNSFRYAGRQHRDGIVKALKPVYTAPSEQSAKDRFQEFTAEWGGRYPAIVKLRRARGLQIVPFLDDAVEIRFGDLHDERDRVDQRPLPAGGQSPRPLPERSRGPQMFIPRHQILDPTGGGRARWVMRWKPALNAFAFPLRRTLPEDHLLMKTAGSHTPFIGQSPADFEEVEPEMNVERFSLGLFLLGKLGKKCDFTSKGEAAEIRHSDEIFVLHEQI